MKNHECNKALQEFCGDVITVAENSTARHISRIMKENGIKAIPVVRNGDIVGIVSEHDIVARVAGEGLSLDDTTAGDFMTREVATVEAAEISENLSVALEILTRQPFRHLPIVENGKLAGMISWTDVRRKLAEKKASLENYFDIKFKKHILRYINQCVLAAVAILAIHIALNWLENSGSVIVALGASTFICFAMPHRQSSRARYIVGGHVTGFVCGAMVAVVMSSTDMSAIPLMAEYRYAIFGSLAVGLATFLMVVINTEHPPAAGLALGLITVEIGDLPLAAVIVVAGTMMLAGIKTALKPVMEDLL